MLHSTVLQSALLDVRAMVREQVDYRELLLQMTRRDLLLRYKQTVMGFGWAVFMPLMNTIVFSVIFIEAIEAIERRLFGKARRQVHD